MKSLKLPLMLLTLIVNTAAGASPLYSWTTKDGTPTYSPDPPEKGVPYVIVGADLQPLQGQPVAPTALSQPAPQPAAANNQAAPSSTGSLVMTPAPGSATNASGQQVKPSATSNNAAAQQPTWKPVIYANDPNPKADKRKLPAATTAPEIAPAVSQVTQECLDVRQRLLALEHQFAQALSAQQMDDAVVRLNNFRKENKGYCGL